MTNSATPAPPALAGFVNAAAHYVPSTHDRVPAHGTCTYIQVFRWRTVNDPELWSIRIFPTGFADAARSVLRHGRPPTARWLR
jgi:hypothetical protein